MSKGGIWLISRSCHYHPRYIRSVSQSNLSWAMELGLNMSLQFLVGVFASLGSALYGYDLGVIAEAIASHNFDNQFKPSAAETGAVVSVFTGGGFFGAAFAGPIGD